MFPEFAYGVRKLGDLDLKILSENSSCIAGCQVINWVKGCFEALDYKYLRQMMLGIHDKPGDHDNVIETYIFRFSYTDGISVTCNGVEISNSNEYDMQMTRRATTALLRTLLIITQTLEPLPPSYYVTMKLLYYDDVTPSDYEPKGFVPADTDNFYFKGNPLTVKVGHVTTPFHSLKFDMKADKKEFEFPDEEPMPSGSIQLQSSGETNNSLNFPVGGSDTLDKAADGKAHSMNGAESPLGYPSKYANMGNDTDAANVEEEENGTVRCPCGSREEEGVMIECPKCRHWQHGVCFGMLEEDDAPEIHMCDLCYRSCNDGFEPKDKDFYKLSHVYMRALCILRRALVCVCDMKTVQPASLAKRLQSDKATALNIIQRMEDEGFITAGTGKAKGKKYVHANLIKKHGIPKYVLGTTKEIFEEDVKLEELNEKTKNLHVTSTPEISVHGTFGQAKEKHQVEVKENPQTLSIPNPPISSGMYGKKRANEIFQGFRTDDSQEPGWDGERMRKRQKASTCKNGVTCDPKM